MKTSSIPQEKLSKAQRNKNYLSKLKTTDKYDDYKKRKADEQRKRRERMKQKESAMPLQERNEILLDRRRAVRERTQKYRANKKNSNVETNEAKKTYSNNATLEKAVTKARKSLPQSPSKKRVVIAKLLSDMQGEDQSQLVNVMPSQVRSAKSINSELFAEIRQFYERDDISVTSPKVSDVKKYVSDSGEQILLPTRHMTLTLKEAYGLFIQERNNIGKGDCSFSAK